MTNVFFTADLHFCHENIIKFNNRPFADYQEMNEALIANWNSIVTRKDTVYLLGDIGMGKRPELVNCISRLNGHIHWVIGNHDRKCCKWPEMKSKFTWMGDYKEINIHDPDTSYRGSSRTRIVAFHYPIASWNGMHHGSWHIHGHCIDLDTEILTYSGWKTRQTISIYDQIATLNPISREIEYYYPNSIIDKQYTGTKINISSRNVNAGLTDKHECVFQSSTGNIYKDLAENFDTLKTRRILLSGTRNIADYDISDDLIKLLVWIAADGSIENTDLIRFHLKKERKINRLKELLSRLEIEFSESHSKAGTVKINFQKPFTLIQYGLKPLSRRVLDFSKRQVDILIEEYLHTDGCKTGKNSFQISTSKPQEANLLQQLLVTNGYSCNLTKRPRSNPTHKTNYVLSGNTKKVWTTMESHKNITTEEVVDEHFWCVNVPNHTIIVRRNGQCHITGNCHGTFYDPNNKQVDIGVDCWDYFPVSYDQLKQYMSKKEFIAVDGHGRKGPYVKGLR